MYCFRVSYSELLQHQCTLLSALLRFPLLPCEFKRLWSCGTHMLMDHTGIWDQDFRQQHHKNSFRKLPNCPLRIQSDVLSFVLVAWENPVTLSRGAPLLLSSKKRKPSNRFQNYTLLKELCADNAWTILYTNIGCSCHLNLSSDITNRYYCLLFTMPPCSWRIRYYSKCLQLLDMTWKLHPIPLFCCTT